MFSTKDTLKEKADGQFVSGLAAAVAAQIDRDAEQQVQALPALRSGEEQFSIATLFLADRLYAKLDAGTFTGLPHLIWNGMDDFVFLSDPQTPFSYERANGRTITPLRMNTDGGSIPRILRGLKKFSSRVTHRHFSSTTGYSPPRSAVTPPITTGSLKRQQP